MTCSPAIAHARQGTQCHRGAGGIVAKIEQIGEVLRQEHVVIERILRLANAYRAADVAWQNCRQRTIGSGMGGRSAGSRGGIDRKQMLTRRRRR